MELIERDAFLYHYLNQLSPSELELQLPNEKSITKGIQFLRKNGFQVHLGQLNALAEEFVIVAVAEGTRSNLNVGLSIGLGCDGKIESAIEKAFWECFRHAISLCNFRAQSVPHILDLNEFLKIQHPDPADHIALSLNPEYARSALEWLVPTSKDKFPQQPLPDDSYHIQLLTPPHPFDKLPLSVAQATNDKLQNLFFGIASPEIINNRRYPRPNELPWNLLLNHPHPLG